MVSFDRKDKCPICKKKFQSKECEHSYSYVMRVLDAASNREYGFAADVKKVRNSQKGK